MPVKGGVTLGNWFLNLSTFHNTFIHILGSHARFSLEVYSDALINLAVFPINKPLSSRTESSTALARFLEEKKCLLQGEDLEQEQDTEEPVKKKVVVVLSSQISQLMV